MKHALSKQLFLALGFAALIGPVAALRETSVLFAAILGATFLGEPLGRRRIAAAGIVVAGIVAVRLGA